MGPGISGILDLSDTDPCEFQDFGSSLREADARVGNAILAERGEPVGTMLMVVRYIDGQLIGSMNTVLRQGRQHRKEARDGPG